jgi:hypothetical protein
MKRLLALLFLFWMPGLAWAQGGNILLEEGQIFRPTTGRHAMVSSAEPISTRIGVEVLRRGGNAVDAAVTMAFVDSEGNLLPMERDPIRVGRAADNDWPFNDSSVSNYHARIKKNKRGSGYEVEDLRSTNGTWVRERRIGGAEVIDPGTKVRFGKIEVLLMTRSQSTG